MERFARHFNKRECKSLGSHIGWYQSRDEGRSGEWKLSDAVSPNHPALRKVDTSQPPIIVSPCRRLSMDR